MSTVEQGIDHRARVRGAATARTKANRALRVAVRDAYAAGVSYAELARMLGVSRQAVRQLAERD